MDDFAADVSTTGVIAASGFTTGNIETSGDADWFRVTLAGGQKYRFYIQGSERNEGPDPGGTLVDPFLKVRDATGTLMASVDNSPGMQFNGYIDFTAPASGTYFLDVSSAQPGGTGTYTLSSRPFVTPDVMAAFLTNGYFTTSGIDTSFPTPQSWSHAALTVNISALNATEQALAMASFRAYEQISSLTFTLVTGAADITYSNGGSQIAQAGAQGVTNGHITSAIVQISTDWVTSQALDTQAYNIYLHELGHALGLGHPGPYNSGAIDYGISNVFANDSLEWSVMSDMGVLGQGLAGRITTPQMADIDAIQRLYGVNGTTRSGDTTYGFHDTAGAAYDFSTFASGVTFTIYDTGGSDTLDASGYGMAQVIDLTPGGFSSIGGFTNNIAIYTTTIIENAVGGSGADSLLGNAADNLLTGGAGNDSIDGAGGWNTAAYSGAKSAYSVSVAADGSVTVTDLRPGSPDGTDHLSHIQILSFADGTTTLGPTTAADEVALGFSTVLREVSPTAADQAAHDSLAAQAAAGSLSLAQAAAQIVTLAQNTSSVATMAYQFFTGGSPSAGGMDFLVSPTGPNANNLNSAYYQHFNIENRYINFAVNLGKLGAGAAAFQAGYGSLDLFHATQKAYGVIFGIAPSDAKVHALLDPAVTLGGVTMTRADYFNAYGQDGLNGIGTKAAMVGWLLAEAVLADVGTYARSNDAFLTDVALHNAAFAVDIIGHYNQASFAFNGG